MGEVLQSAQIYAFPVRGRFASRDRKDEVAAADKNSFRVVNGIASSSSWYHEQAILESDRGWTNGLPPKT